MPRRHRRSAWNGLAGTVALYALYNLKTFGSWEPSYSKTINSMGFSPWDLGFKFISLVTDSSAYGIDDGHLSHALPLVIPLSVLSVLSLLLLAVPQKLLVVAALINFISYMSFNDLVPTGLFTFNNIHYFTWSIAVFAVSAISILKVLIQTSIHKPKFRRRHYRSWRSLILATTTLMHASTDPPRSTHYILNCRSMPQNGVTLAAFAAKQRSFNFNQNADQPGGQTKIPDCLSSRSIQHPIQARFT